MSSNPSWSPQDTIAFRAAWSRFRREFVAINERAGLKPKAEVNLGINFRVPHLRYVYEAHLAEFLGTKNWERFMYAANGKFSIKACKAAYHGIVCDWCQERFSYRAGSTHTCSECMKTPKGRKDHYQRIAANRSASNMAKYGVDNLARLESTKQKQREAFRKQDPEGKATNAMHLRKYREKHAKSIARVDHIRANEKRQRTYLRRWGRGHWLQSAKGKRSYRKAVEALYGLGVDNPMKDPSLRLKHRELMQDLFSDDEWLALWKKSVKAGVVARYGVEDITSQPNGFMLNERQRYYPDFYIRSERLYVEVKSTYTLLTGDSKDAFEKNVYKAEQSEKLGKRVLWVVGYPKTNAVVKLPQSWYRMEKEKVSAYLDAAHERILEKRAA